MKSVLLLNQPFNLTTMKTLFKLCLIGLFPFLYNTAFSQGCADVTITSNPFGNCSVQLTHNLDGINAEWFFNEESLGSSDQIEANSVGTYTLVYDYIDDDETFTCSYQYTVIHGNSDGQIPIGGECISESEDLILESGIILH